MRSSGLYDTSFVKKLVFYHVGVELEDHVFEGLRLLEAHPEDLVEFIEAAKVEIVHVVQVGAHIFAHVLLSCIELIGYICRRLRVDVVLAQALVILLCHIRVLFDDPRCVFVLLIAGGLDRRLPMYVGKYLGVTAALELVLR